MTSLQVPEWLLQAIQSLGVAGGPIMFFFWWIEYRERRKWQDDLLERNERFIAAHNELANVMRDVTSSVATSQATLKDQNTILHEMAATMRSLVRRREQ